MKLGIGTYTFAWHIGIPGSLPLVPFSYGDLLSHAVRLSAKSIQFCENLSLVHAPEETLQTLDACGLQIEIGTRGLDLNNLRAHADLAARFGSPFFRVVIDTNDFEPSWDEAAQQLEQIVPALGPIQIAIENHDRFSVRQLLALCERTGVKITLDTANSLGCLEGPAALAPLFPHTVCLHVKDVRARRVPCNMGFEIVGTAAGTGQVDIPWFLDLAKQHGVGSVILESWAPQTEIGVPPLITEMSFAEQGMAFLRAIS
jgi:sugar phosphate isomerase/epimerase